MNNDRSIDAWQVQLYNERKNRVKNQGKTRQDEDEEDEDKEEQTKAQKTKNIIKDEAKKPQKQSSSFFACCGPRDNAFESDGGASDEDEQSQ